MPMAVLLPCGTMNSDLSERPLIVVDLFESRRTLANRTGTVSGIQRFL